MRQEYAETLALKALTWLAGNDEVLPVFMGATGVSEADLKSRAAEPDLLVSVLDFLMMDDAWVQQFCDAEGFDYTEPMIARTYLPGGGHVHWT
ncbi:DUF3572 domain-containing protein [Parasulfitobacter algicola]|uniref:DUF3572 domain-containing protein n=1 Tax=Parasulfitobacter algicola TaxID=2614809 RepID=A0ABX2IM01_9RHOB|nr:DUF3572 domain-containing protein [Sulfitobacter algicola]NSX53911.1 DUF3572 domain-containing protein [Sulfitobacter algicola]